MLGRRSVFLVQSSMCTRRKDLVRAGARARTYDVVRIEAESEGYDAGGVEVNVGRASCAESPTASVLVLAGSSTS